MKEIIAGEPSEAELEKKLERTRTSLRTSQVVVAISTVGTLLLVIIGYFARDFTQAGIFGSIMLGGNTVYLLILHKRTREIQNRIAQVKKRVEVESDQCSRGN